VERCTTEPQAEEADYPDENDDDYYQDDAEDDDEDDYDYEAT
jgi:hypothetical protein